MDKEQLIDNIIEWLKDYEDDTGVIEIWSNQLILLLKEYLQEPILTYEQWFERWKQVGYKEWRRARSKEDTAADRLKIIEEVIWYIWQNEWREDSEDYYRKHFWLKLKYK